MQNLKRMPPPNILEKALERAKEQKMFLVHMSPDELEGLDNAQGGPDIDEVYGIRRYEKLGSMLENKEFREIFIRIFSEVFNDIADDSKLNGPLKKAYEEAKRISLPYKKTPMEKSKSFKMLGNLGKKGGYENDTEFAFIPENLTKILVEFMGGTVNENPETGLMQFGLFKEIIRVGGTIAGAVMGGPVGAGIGNALGHMATGNSLGNSAMSGLKNFGLFSAGNAIAGALGGGAGFGYGQLAKGFAPFMGAQMAQGAAQNFMGSGQDGQYGGMGQYGTGNYMPASEVGILKKSEFGDFSKPQVNVSSANQSSGGSGGIWGAIENVMSSNTVKNLMPLVSTGLAYMGDKRRYDDELRASREHANYLKSVRHERGFDVPFSPKKIKRTPNPNYRELTEEDRALGRYAEPEYFIEEENYKKGGNVQYNSGEVIKGRGSGQADLIKTKVPVNSEIIDATTVSMFGDGSSKFGSQILKKMEKEIKKSVPKSKINSISSFFEKKQGKAPVYLSNEEYRVDPVTVSILGNGNVDEGSKIFRRMVKNIRAHKMSNGLGLPPKAKSPFEYMNMEG